MICIGLLGLGGVVWYTRSTQAQEEAADYVGVGPVFETATKETGYTPRGVGLAAEVTGALRIPAFAIGGIHPKTLRRLVGTGTRRVAVSSAICGADDPLAAARELAEMLG